MTEDEPVIRFTVVESDTASAERETAVLELLTRLGIQATTAWHKKLILAIEGLAEFPGPQSWAIDEEVSIYYGRPVRRLLYRGPSGKSKLVYRIYYTIFESADEEPSIIRILRIVPGSWNPFTRSGE